MAEFDVSSPSGSWVARFRFRISKMLNSDASSLSLVVDGRDVTLRTQGDVPLKEADWLILRAPGFQTAEDAEQFVGRLKLATLVASVETGNGIDPGEGRPTGSMNPDFFRKTFGSSKQLIPNNHGTQVYWDDGNQTFVSMSASLSVFASPETFISAVAAGYDEELAPSVRAIAALEVLSLSRMAREPLAEATLCIAAVELLALREDWTPLQRKLLGDLRKQAQEWAPDELDVADAVGKAYKSVRGGIKDLVLNKLSLGEQTWRDFDAVYGMRSDIFHSLEPIKREAINEFASRARPVCEKIVLAAVRKPTIQ